jgi:DUF4097 and DUF4098 domain-containing protein YvlB
MAFRIEMSAPMARRVSVRVKAALLVWALAVGLASLRAGDEAYVQRGTPERRGQVWVETDQCDLPMHEGGRLILRADLGSIRVSPGPADRVQCQVRLIVYSASESEARSYFTHYELGVRRLESAGVLITGKFPPGRERARRLAVNFDVQVPLRFNLDLQTDGGGVSVERLDGELRATTAGGDIRTGDITGPVHVETAGGAIVLGNIAQRVEARTAGGPVRVGDVQGDASLATNGGEIMAGIIHGTVHAETAGGDIMLRAASGPVVAQTAGGQIQLGQCGGTVHAETAGGSIRLEGARGRVDAETAGGSIDLLQLMNVVRAETAAGHIMAQIGASRENFGPSELDTDVGDVQVFLPTDLPLTIKAVIDESAGHRITSDFPLAMHREGDSDSLECGELSAHGAVGGGGAELSVHTSVGNIEIRKLDPAAVARLKAYQDFFWKRWQQRWQEYHKQEGNSNPQ